MTICWKGCGGSRRSARACTDRTPPRSGPAATPTRTGFIALTWACWSQYPGIRMDVDAEMPEYRALASYYAEQGGALWAAEADGQIVG